jgi:hypothetical protein
MMRSVCRLTRRARIVRPPGGRVNKRGERSIRSTCLIVEHVCEHNINLFCHPSCSCAPGITSMSAENRATTERADAHSTTQRANVAVPARVRDIQRQVFIPIRPWGRSGRARGCVASTTRLAGHMALRNADFSRLHGTHAAHRARVRHTAWPKFGSERWHVASRRPPHTSAPPLGCPTATPAPHSRVAYFVA